LGETNPKTQKKKENREERKMIQQTQRNTISDQLIYLAQWYQQSDATKELKVWTNCGSWDSCIEI